MSEKWTLDFGRGNVWDTDGETVCFLAGGPSERSRKNGLKIAAAPELLNALKRARIFVVASEQYQHGWADAEDLMDEIDAVIRKAQGD